MAEATPTSLLQELDGLPISARIKRMVELGRQSLTQPSAKALLNEVHASGFSGKTLRLYACLGSRDQVYARHCLVHSPSKSLRELARSVLLDISSDEEVAEVLLQLGGLANAAQPGKLLHIMHKLRKGGRRGAAAHVVHGAAMAVDPAAKVEPSTDSGAAPLISSINLSKEQHELPSCKLLATLLPFGNSQQVQAMLSQLLPSCQVDLSLVSQWHPQETVDAIMAQQPNARWGHLQSCYQHLLRGAPEATYTLFCSLPRSATLHGPFLQAMLLKFPDRMMAHLMQMQSTEANSPPLTTWLQRAQAARKQQLAARKQQQQQQAREGAAGQTRAVPAQAAAAEQHAGADGDDAVMSSPRSQAPSSDEGDGGSWVEASRASSVMSWAESDAEAAMGMQLDSVAGEDAAADAAGPGAAPGGVPAAAATQLAAAAGGRPEVYALLKRSPLITSFNAYKNPNMHNVAGVPMPALLQACLMNVQHTLWVLVRLPVPQRLEFYAAWKAWWRAQHDLLGSAADAIPPSITPRDSADAVAAARKSLQAHGLNLWKTPKVLQLLPLSCRLDLAHLAHNMPGGPSEQFKWLVGAIADTLDPDHLLPYLQDNTHLWQLDKLDAQGRMQAEQLLRRLSGPQQAQLLLSHPAIEADRQLLASLAAVKPCAALTAQLLPSFKQYWAAGCDLLLAQVLGSETKQDNVPPAYKALDSVSEAELERLLQSLLDTLSAEAAVRLVQRVLQQPVMVASCKQLLLSLGVRPTALEGLYKAWEAAVEEPLWAPGSEGAAALAQLSGSDGTPAADESPQAAMYHAMRATLQVMEDKGGMWMWLAETTCSSARCPYAQAYEADVPKGHNLLHALPPACRAALVVRAARSLAVLLPEFPNLLRPYSLHGRVGSGGRELGSWQVLECLRYKPVAGLRGWSSQDAQQLLTVLPDLWVQVPDLLPLLPGPQVVRLLQQWQAYRSGLEGRLAAILSRCPNEVLPASTPAAAATPAAGAGGDAARTAMAGDMASDLVATTITPAVLAGSTPATAARSLAEATQRALASKADPVISALLSTRHQPLLHRLLAQEGQGCTGPVAQAVCNLLRQFAYEEWEVVPMTHLPPAERAWLARAHILRATEQHSGPTSGLWSKACQWLPYLTWREIVDTPCVKDKLQARDAGERADALEHIIKCADKNPDLMPQLLQAIHTRRREQDDTRRRVLATLGGQEVLGRWAQLAAAAAVREAASQQVDTLASAWLGSEHIAQLIPTGAASPQVGELQRQAVFRWKASQAQAVQGSTHPDDARKLTALHANLPGVALIVKDALSARDLSPASAGLLADVLLVLLPVDASWAASQLALLVGHSGLQAVTPTKLCAAIKEHLARLCVVTETIRNHVEAVVAEAVAGLPQPSPRKQEEPEAAAAVKPHVRGRARHKGARAAALQAAREASRKVTDPPRKPSDLLQEQFMGQVLGAVVPPLLAALATRQDGLAGCLQLLNCVNEVLFQLQKGGKVDTTARLQPAMTQLLVGTLLGPITALPSVAALPTCSPITSVGLVAWYADQVLLRQPDTYPELTSLVLPKDERMCEMLRRYLLNSIHDSLPCGRFDLLELFLFHTHHMPEVTAKAVSLLFKYHGAKVQDTVPRLLAADPTFIMLPKVFWYCVRHRQDLLPALDWDPTNPTTWPTTTSDQPQAHDMEMLFKEGAPSSALKTVQAGKRVVVKGGRALFSKKPQFNYAGWSKSDLHTSMWLGMPQLSLSSTRRLSDKQQLAIANGLMAALKTKGKLDVAVVRRILNRLAALPALPASALLDLLDNTSSSSSRPVSLAAAGDDATMVDAAEAAGTGAAGAAAAAAGGGQGEDAAAEAMRDVVLSCLVKLDDMSQAWESLLQALSSNTSSTALAAVTALLAADIRALGSSSSTTSSSAGQVATAVAGGSTDSGPVAAALLDKMRQLPWQRPAVMREVIKLLGQMAAKSPLAMQELCALADYAQAGLRTVAPASATATAATPATAGAGAAAAAGAVAGAGAGMHVEGQVPLPLPLPAARELHRSAHLQLLTTLQAFYAQPSVQAAFLVAARAEDKEIACGAAYVPTAAQQRAAPAVLPACVNVFLALLDHPEQTVRLRAVRQWADGGGDGGAVVPLAEGLPVVQRMMDMLARLQEQQQQPATASSSLTAEAHARLMHEASEAKQWLQKWFGKVLQ